MQNYTKKCQYEKCGMIFESKMETAKYCCPSHRSLQFILKKKYGQNGIKLKELNRGSELHSEFHFQEKYFRLKSRIQSLKLKLLDALSELNSIQKETDNADVKFNNTHDTSPM